MKIDRLSLSFFFSIITKYLSSMSISYHRDINNIFIDLVEYKNE